MAKIKKKTKAKRAVKRKRVNAPLSYDPGKGRPQEYLAYLNEQEMAALRRINGNNMERGPSGLPSFPPNDAIGSGQDVNTNPSSGGVTAGSQNVSGGVQNSIDSNNGYDSSDIGGSDSGSSYGTDSSSWSGSDSGGSFGDGGDSGGISSGAGISGPQGGVVSESNAADPGYQGPSIGSTGGVSSLGGSAESLFNKTENSYRSGGIGDLGGIGDGRISNIKTQPRDELGAMPSNLDPNGYGWSSTGPNKLSAYQNANIYGGTLARQGQKFTQDQYDTLLDANTITDPALNAGVNALSPAQRQNAAILSSASRFSGIDRDIGIKMGAIESQFGKLKDRPGSDQTGLTQIGGDEFAKYADPNSKALGKNNPWANAQAGTSYMGDLSERYEDEVGTPATAGDVYGMYNQGYSGYTSLRANPDRLAANVVRASAVRNNLHDDTLDARTVKAGVFADHIAGLPDQAFNAATEGASTAFRKKEEELRTSGVMPPDVKRATQYGDDTLYSPNALGSLYKNSGVYGINSLDRKIKAEQALLGQTIGASQYGGTVTANVNTKLGTDGTVDRFTGGIGTHWTASKAPLARISGRGYNVTIDDDGNINYATGFNPDGTMPATWHMKGYNNELVGVSAQGTGEPNAAQQDAAQVMGANWMNDDPFVTSHGYQAGTRVRLGERSLDPQFRKNEREGVALAEAFNRGLDGAEPTINTPSDIDIADSGIGQLDAQGLTGKTDFGTRMSDKGIVKTIPGGVEDNMLRRAGAGTLTDPYNAAETTIVEDPRVGLPGGGFPAAKPPSAFTVDPRLNISSTGFPAAKPPSVFAADPRLGLPSGGFPEANYKIGTEFQGPQGFTNLPSVPDPTGESITDTLPNPTQGTQMLGGYSQAIQGAIGSLTDALNNFKPKTPEEALERQKLASAVTFAMSPTGRLVGADKIASKKFNEAYPNLAGDTISGIKSGVNSLVQGSMTALVTADNMGLGGVSALTNAEDAARGAETVQQAEGSKLYNDRIPGSEDYRIGKTDEGIVTISNPANGASVISHPDQNYTDAFMEESPEALKNAAAYGQAMTQEDYNDFVNTPQGVEATVLADDVYKYPTIDGVPVQPDQIDPLDMERMRARRRGEQYLTDKEKAAIKYGGTAARVATSNGIVKVLTGVGDKVATMAYGKTPLHGIANPKDVMRDYYSSPTWEREQIQRVADGYNQRQADLGGENYVGPRGDRDRTYRYDDMGIGSVGEVADAMKNRRGGENKVSTLGTPDQTAIIHAQWANGINIPNPNDPDYSAYVAWRNSQRAAANDDWGWGETSEDSWG